MACLIRLYKYLSAGQCWVELNRDELMNYTVRLAVRLIGRNPPPLSNM